MLKVYFLMTSNLRQRRKVEWIVGRQCIGTTEGPAMPVERNMCISDLPYKDRKLVLKKTHGNRGLEYETVNEGKHRMSGYTGHTHGQQVCIL